MFHPILDKTWKIIIYALSWIFLGFIHFSVLKNYFTIDLTNSLIDSIVTTIILGALNLGIWYYIKYNRFEGKNFINVLINILITGLIINGVWILLDWILVLVIQEDKKTFNLIFENVLLFKACFGILLYFFVTLAYYLMIYYANYKENLERKNELSTMLKDSELSNLKSQINPHFLFNSLNSISYLIYTNPENAHNSIVKLSEYFRYSLSKGDEQLTTLKDELDNIFRYLDIEKIRFTNKMLIEKQINENCLKYKLPVMILQPIAENAVKHGVYESTELSKISIEISDNTDFFTVLISNNYTGNKKNKKGTSTGLKNVSQRLKLIYKRDDLMIINKSEKNYELKINFPKNIEL